MFLYILFVYLLWCLGGFCVHYFGVHLHTLYIYILAVLAVFGVLMTTKQIKTKWDKPGSRFNEHPPNEKARDDQDDPDLDGPD